MQSLVRAADRPGDAGAIARVHVDSWRVTYGGGLLPAPYLDGLSVAQLTDAWQRTLAQPRRAGSRVWVADDGPEVIGFCQSGPCGERDLAGFGGEIFMLYVRPDHLGRGVGQALLERARQSLIVHPFYWLVIWVVEGNTGARAFYQRMGLRPDGSWRLDRFSGEDVRVIRYAMALNPAVNMAQFIRG